MFIKKKKKTLVNSADRGRGLQDKVMVKVTENLDIYIF